MIAALLSDLWPYLATAGVAVLAYFGVLAKGKRIANDKNELRQLKEARDTAERIDNAKPADNIDDARANLTGWLRKGKR